MQSYHTYLGFIDMLRQEGGWGGVGVFGGVEGGGKKKRGAHTYKHCPPPLLLLLLSPSFSLSLSRAQTHTHARLQNKPDLLIFLFLCSVRGERFGRLTPRKDMKRRGERGGRESLARALKFESGVPVR